jgi:hypothetical protein
MSAHERQGGSADGHDPEGNVSLPNTVRSDSDAGVPADCQLALSVAIEAATAEEIAGITEEIRRWIEEAGPGCDVSPVTVPGRPGDKGLLTVLGTLGLKFLEPGALKALIDCLAVYIKERRREVVVTVKAADGTSVEIRAGGIGRGDLDKLANIAHGLLASTGGTSHA